jgi:hypothetical protein
VAFGIQWQWYGIVSCIRASGIRHSAHWHGNCLQKALKSSDSFSSVYYPTRDPGESSASLSPIHSFIPISHLGAWRIKCESELHSFIHSNQSNQNPDPVKKSIDRRVRAHQSVSQIRAWQIKCESEVDRSPGPSSHQSVSGSVSQTRAWQIKCKSSASLSSIHSFLQPSQNPDPVKKSIAGSELTSQSVSQSVNAQSLATIALTLSPVSQCASQSVKPEPGKSSASQVQV